VVVISSIYNNSVNLQVRILISAPKAGSFQSHPNAAGENNVRNAENQTLMFPKVAQQHHVGEVSKSITFVLHIISIYSVPNIVEIGQNMYTLQ